MSFLQILKIEGAKVNPLLEAFCAELPESEVSRAMRYSLFSDGKRLRPVLALQTAKMLGAPEGVGNVERIAAAVEMLHAYSLIHDDLPCMDDDDFRRGKPSCHKAFGCGTAVLAGDALLNFAFETLLSGDYSKSYFDAIRLISECAGIHGMLGGQSVDISDGGKDSVDALTALAREKTAKLIVASTASVGIYLNCSAAKLQALKDFALNFGVAFQIADDLIDAKSGEASNFAKLAGVERTKSLLDEHSANAFKALGVFGSDAAFLSDLIKFNKERRK